MPTTWCACGRWKARASCAASAAESPRSGAWRCRPMAGTPLSGGEDACVRLWDLEHGRELARFEGHTDWVTAVAFSPDGRFALSRQRRRHAAAVEAGRRQGSSPLRRPRAMASPASAFRPTAAAPSPAAPMPPCATGNCRTMRPSSQASGACQRPGCARMNVILHETRAVVRGWTLSFAGNRAFSIASTNDAILRTLHRPVCTGRSPCRSPRVMHHDRHRLHAPGDRDGPRGDCRRPDARGLRFHPRWSGASDGAQYRLGRH